MGNFLDRIRSDIDERLAELHPLIDEHNSLEIAAKALGNAAASSASGSTAAPARRGPGRPRGSKTGTTAKARSAAVSAPRQGRRKGTGKRSAQALAAITDQPGITPGELASRMDVNKTYLYRVLPSLQSEGKITKKGRGWHPKS